MNKKKICGVVVLYNPPIEIIDNIKSYINQIDFLFIVDNSDKTNFQIKNHLLKLPSIKYIANKNNLGIAVALNIGAKEAIERNYKYLLTMDQDSKANKNMIKQLSYYVKKYNYDFKQVGIISPYHFDTSKANLPDAEISDSLYVMSSGNLLNLEAYKDVGKFCEELFMDRVDNEYCLRLKSKGYKILLINKVILQHSLGKLSKKSFLGRTQYCTNHPPLRRYYMTRNALIVSKKYKQYFPEYAKKEKQIFFYEFSKILLFEDQKIKKLKMIIKGYLDYRKRITGKILSM